MPQRPGQPRPLSETPRLRPLFLALRTLCIATAASMATAGLLVPQAAYAQAAPAPDSRELKRFDIAAGPLEGVLNQLGRDTGVLITFESKLTEGMRSPGVRGSHTVQQALAQALEGTGLGMVRAAGGGYALRTLPAMASTSTAAATAPASGTTLAEVRVVDTAPVGGPTEGTGAYTTRSASTATHFALSPRETPQSISVVTRQQMDDQGLVSVPEILDKTPGVTVGRNDSERATFYARGFPIENFQFDGVPSTLDTSNQYTTAIGDSIVYDRVEIVKGATGLLTGAGYPSATINLVRKRPTAEFAGSLSFGAGSWDRLRTTADFSGPLNASGSVRARIVAAAQNANSYVDYYKRDTRNLYGVIEADLTPDTLLTVGVDHMTSRADGATFGHLPLFYSDGTQTRFSRSLNPASRWSYWDNDSTNTFASLKHDFGGGWKLDVAASHLDQSKDVWFGSAYNGSVDRYTGQGIRMLSGLLPSESKTDAVNVALTGPFTLGGRTHELMLGAGYSRQHQQAELHNTVFTTVPNYFAWDGYIQQPASPKRADRDTVIAEKGVSAALRLRPADALSVIVGARASWYRLHDQSTGVAGDISVDDDLNVRAKIIPYAGIVYDLDRTWSVYASYTDIFHPQTYYKDANDRPIAPLTGKSTEVGVKAEFLDRRVNASLALFHVKQNNSAQYVSVNDDTGNEIYKAVDGITSKGLEMEVAGQITPSWNLSAGYTFRTSRQPQQQDVILSAVNTNQPRHLVKLNTSYRLPGEWSKWVVGGSLTWQSRTYYETSDDNHWRADQPAYAVVGLMARYEFDRHLSMTLNINNLFDKTYMPGLGSYGTGVYGDPRNALLTVNYKF
ncbi:TonB-dependent siderophore receptor [Variovorax paradoxus]|uniref:Ferripyoverdine receptor n=1 Tax=Variovorax paradoxus TaxID=34073 RepID=A0A679JBK8_VARPD|nr:Ferripyoverdine receptor [Variovorax paradoxus]